MKIELGSVFGIPSYYMIPNIKEKLFAIYKIIKTKGYSTEYTLKELFEDEF